MRRAETTEVTKLRLPWAWVAVATFVLLGTGALLIARPSVAQVQSSAVTDICRMVGQEHPGCLTAAALATSLDYGDCAMATQAVPVLSDQLSNFGLNREFAVIRADTLGELRDPFERLEFSFATRCQ